jgi:hypothetical protein
VSSMGRGLFACLVLLRMQEYSRADTSVDVTSANQQAESTAVPGGQCADQPGPAGFWYRVITSDVGSVAPR